QAPLLGPCAWRKSDSIDGKRCRASDAVGCAAIAIADSIPTAALSPTSGLRGEARRRGDSFRYSRPVHPQKVNTFIAESAINEQCARPLVTPCSATLYSRIYFGLAAKLANISAGILAGEVVDGAHCRRLGLGHHWRSRDHSRLYIPRLWPRLG